LVEKKINFSNDYVDTPQLELESKRTLHRLIPCVERGLSAVVSADQNDWQKFLERLQIHFPSHRERKCARLHADSLRQARSHLCQLLGESTTHPSHIFEQYSVHTLKHLRGVSKISLQSDMTAEPLDFLVFG
jgi:hypothetical protein